MSQITIDGTSFILTNQDCRIYWTIHMWMNNSHQDCQIYWKECRIYWIKTVEYIKKMWMWTIHIHIFSKEKETDGINHWNKISITRCKNAPRRNFHAVNIQRCKISTRQFFLALKLPVAKFSPANLSRTVKISKGIGIDKIDKKTAVYVRYETQNKWWN